jgi:polysaccharide biosynthesis protein PslG
MVIEMPFCWRVGQPAGYICVRIIRRNGIIPRYRRAMRRRLGLSKVLVSALALLLGCAVSAAWLWHSKSGAEALQNPSARRGGAQQRVRQPSRRHVAYFGISDPNLIIQSAKVQAAELAKMRSIGINSIRIDANWRWVQYGGPQSFDWTMLDRVVRSARNARMSVDLIVEGCPQWAAPPGRSSDAWPQPASAPRFAVWAADVARRYAPEGVKFFEIWNEPNDTKFWQPSANPAFYTRMLADSYRAIKKVDPSAFVIAGDLAPVNSRGGSLRPMTFLRDIYADGAKPYFNAVSIHPYCYPALPDTYEPWSAWSQMSQTSPSLRSVMRRYGDARKPLWLTEFGAPSSGPAGVGANGQAAELREAIALAKSTSWIGAIFIYTWQDAGTNTRAYGDWFGLLTYRGREKAAYHAVAVAIEGKG